MEPLPNCAFEKFQFRLFAFLFFFFKKKFAIKGFPKKGAGMFLFLSLASGGKGIYI
jgi:hypothetical protein